MTSEEKVLMVKFSEPLKSNDSEKQTEGCRHSNPEICKNMYVKDVCAFSSEDGICRRPSASWKKQYNKLKEDV